MNEEQLAALDAEIAAKLAEIVAKIGVEGLTLTGCGGNCPFQAYGTFLGYGLYFRSRGSRWSLRLEDEDLVWGHGEAYVIPAGCYEDDLEWAKIHAAGYISQDEVIEILKTWLPVAAHQIGEVENG